MVDKSINSIDVGTSGTASVVDYYVVSKGKFWQPTQRVGNIDHSNRSRTWQNQRVGKIPSILRIRLAMGNRARNGQRRRRFMATKQLN